MTGRNSLGKSRVEGTPSKEHPPKRTLTKGMLMAERDLSLPDSDDDNVDAGDAVEKHRIRYNPSRPSKLDAADADRIRYNPSRSSTDDADV